MVPQSGIIPMKPPSHPPAAIFFNITDDHIRLHLGISTKNFFYNISTKELKIGFQNRKWNYFSHFQVSDQKTSFITSSPRLPRNSKFVFKTKNGIIQTGNGIISPTSRPLITKLLHINQGVKNWFSKQEMELSKQKMELFLPILGL